MRPAAYAILAVAVCTAAATLPSTGKRDVAKAAVAPVGQGFTVTPADLAFILKQIKIAERHSRAFEGNPDPGTPINPDPIGDPMYCQALVGPNTNQIPDRLTSYGLRTVDGSCNNLFPGRDKFAAADVPFPRLTKPIFSAAQPSPTDFFGPGSGTIPSSSYAQKKGFVFDDEPRVISNLIVDQTSTNPAAIAAAEFPVRTQGDPGVHHCTTDPDPTATPPVVGVPAGCVPSHQTLFIPNVTTDVGLSPPYNSLFTFFGQFFDHGVDQTVKSGGTVFVPLRADDPLITLGPDGKPNTGDEVPPGQQFMVLTRAQNQPGPDGVLGDRAPTDPGAGPCTSLNVPAGCDESADDVQNANNTDTPWVDQSQTYTSHAAHQVFLREYRLNSANHPVSTGKLLGGLPAGQTYLNSPDGTDGIGTWAAVKKQAADVARPEARRQGRRQCADDRCRPVRQVHPGPAPRPAAVRAEGRHAARGQPRQPGAGARQRRLFRHAVPDGHRAQRGSDRAGARRRLAVRDHHPRTLTTRRRPTSPISPSAPTTTRC